MMIGLLPCCLAIDGHPGQMGESRRSIKDITPSSTSLLVIRVLRGQHA